MFKKVSTYFAVALLLALVGCNTLRGMGQDVQKAGEVIEDAAKKK